MTTLKSIWAILAGFLLVVILSVGTDVLLEKTELMKQPFDSNPVGFIIFVIFYRSFFGTTGSYLTARLSPGKPMMHSLIGGAIGLLLTIVGTVVMWDTPPHWYPIALIVTTLPGAWLGGWIFLKRS
jgi:glycerol uptake facilitator-like aquaporin